MEILQTTKHKNKTFFPARPMAANVKNSKCQAGNEEQEKTLQPHKVQGNESRRVEGWKVITATKRKEIEREERTAERRQLLSKMLIWGKMRGGWKTIEGGESGKALTKGGKAPKMELPPIPETSYSPDQLKALKAVRGVDWAYVFAEDKNPLFERSFADSWSNICGHLYHVAVARANDFIYHSVDKTKGFFYSRMKGLIIDIYRKIQAVQLTDIMDEEGDILPDLAIQNDFEQYEEEQKALFNERRDYFVSKMIERSASSYSQHNKRISKITKDDLTLFWQSKYNECIQIQTLTDEWITKETKTHNLR